MTVAAALQRRALLALGALGVVVGLPLQLAPLVVVLDHLADAVLELGERLGDRLP